MGAAAKAVGESIDRASLWAREALAEQILWLIRLRWIAVGCIIAAGLVAFYVFPVLASPVPIYACAGILLVSNIVYFLLATKRTADAGRRDIVLGMVQVEADLVILATILHFSGGVVNLFFLFCLFHIIIATIILPRNLSFAVGVTAILLFGLLAANELNAGAWFGYHPLRLSARGGLWRNRVYVLGAFTAFVCTVVLTQYLTRMIIVRMTAKELEAARNSDVLGAVINAIAEGLIFITGDGEVTICNPAASVWKQGGKASEDNVSIDDFTPVLAHHIRGQLARAEAVNGAAETITFDTAGPEPRHIEAKSCPVVGVDGKRLGYVVVGLDLTGHKKLEEDLLERTEEVTEINEMLKMSRIEMAQREKMVAIGQMATGIAHEIGNPLASLSSVAQYLGRKLSTHEQKEQLLLIEYQVHRISNILKRMLSLSRPATREYKWTDINELIDNTLSLINFDKRAKSVRIENIPRLDLPTIWLNPQNFEQVLLNVFINALDAMKARQDQKPRVLKITRQPKNGAVEIRISDTGIGMSPEVCRRAFESFFTTKEIGKGAGLGLFISYNLVTEVDGTIELESEPGEGTTVIIRLPRRPKKHLIGSQGADNAFPDRAKAV